jgi:hypothetical protein
MSAEQKGTDAQAATQAEATVSSCPCAPAHNHQTQLSALFALSGNDLIARSGVPALCVTRAREVPTPRCWLRDVPLPRVRRAGGRVATGLAGGSREKHAAPGRGECVWERGGFSVDVNGVEILTNVRILPATFARGPRIAPPLDSETC